MNLRIIIFIFFSGLTACSTGSNQSTKIATIPSGEQYLSGKVYPEIHCQADSGISYALYIPVGYSADKTYPLVLFYDAHARGNLPAEKYRKLADKYGVILAGHNNSQNRQTPEMTTSLTNKVLTDIKLKFSMDPKAVIASGFSGGARIATALALSRFDIMGAIACGAGNPGQINVSDISSCIVATVGDEDFNYLEVHEFIHELKKANPANRVIEFHGEHDWAPEAVFDQGLKTMVFYGMRKNIIHLSSETIDDFYENDLQYLQHLVSQERFDSAYYVYTLINTNYTGIRDLSDFNKKYKEMILGKYTDPKPEILAGIFRKEKELQANYLPKLGEESLDWWQAEVQKINQTRMLSSNMYIIKMYSRILNYLSLASNMKASASITAKDTSKAAYFLQVYEWVDPDNPDVFFLKALLSSLMQKDEDVSMNLDKAIELNYSDKSRLLTEPLLNTYREEIWFKKLIAKLE